jgi:hypothetical protein
VLYFLSQIKNIILHCRHPRLIVPKSRMGAPHPELRLFILIYLTWFWVDSNGWTVFCRCHSSWLVWQNWWFSLMLTEPVVKSVNCGNAWWVSIVCFAHFLKIKLVWVWQLNLFIHDWIIMIVILIRIEMYFAHVLWRLQRPKLRHKYERINFSIFSHVFKCGSLIWSNLEIFLISQLGSFWYTSLLILDFFFPFFKVLLKSDQIIGQLYLLVIFVPAFTLHILDSFY